MPRDLTLAARLHLDAQRWEQGASRGLASTRKFVGSVKREFDTLRGFARSTAGTLASLGAGYSVASTILHSARTDQTLSRIKQTAGLTADQTERLRSSLYGMAKETGTAFDDLQEGFGQLAAGGLTFDQALPTIDAINRAMRVTGSEATTLAGALQSAATNFGFDLSQPKVATELLDKMTAAGRAGVIEIEDLANVFGTAANEAKAAGLTFEQTLALFEGMGTATTKDRVGTLVASTLRVFTNDTYMKAAQKATGVKFFDKNNERRAALEIFQDIKAQYDKLTNDKARFKFISQAFGKADLDTIKGIRQALDGGNLQKVLQIVQDVEHAGGTIKRDFGEAMQNAVAQGGVLKAVLGETGDALARPVNAALTNLIKHATGKKEDGGLEMSGGQIAAAGAGTLAAAYLGSRVAGGLLGRLLGGGASLGSGIAMGAALDKAGAAAPVFVVGAAPGVFGGAAGGLGTAAAGAATGGVVRRVAQIGILRAALAGAPVSALLGAGAAGAGTVAAGVGVAGVGGYAAGKWASDHLIPRAIGDAIGKSIAQVLALAGNKDAQAALKLDVNVKTDGHATASVRPDFSGVRGNVRSTVRTGRMMDTRAGHE